MMIGVADALSDGTADGGMAGYSMAFMSRASPMRTLSTNDPPSAYLCVCARARLRARLCPHTCPTVWRDASRAALHHAHACASHLWHIASRALYSFACSLRFMTSWAVCQVTCVVHRMLHVPRSMLRYLGCASVGFRRTSAPSRRRSCPTATRTRLPAVPPQGVSAKQSPAVAGKLVSKRGTDGHWCGRREPTLAIPTVLITWKKRSRIITYGKRPSRRRHHHHHTRTRTRTRTHKRPHRPKHRDSDDRDRQTRTRARSHAHTAHDTRKHTTHRSSAALLDSSPSTSPTQPGHASTGTHGECPQRRGAYDTLHRRAQVEALVFAEDRDRHKQKHIRAEHKRHRQHVGPDLRGRCSASQMP
jgi:hypothetical protein